MKVHELQELLEYDRVTGKFKWIKARTGVTVGSEAGTVRKDGYRQITVNRVIYFAHRLAWLYTYGVWPKDQLDHINADRDDNRIENLQECTHKENHRLKWERIRKDKS
jgi:hypothetical protein